MTSIVPLLEVRELKKYFPLRTGVRAVSGGVIKAVENVDFAIAPGNTLALVGESGSGKTTVAKTIIHLLEPTSGQIIFAGSNITKLNRPKLRLVRQSMGMVFQDPTSCLSPRRRIRDIVADPMVVNHTLTSQTRISDAVAELLQRVELSPEHMSHYPHQLSGGEKQRVGIARALSVRPKLLILDEPTSALDVSIQAKIIGLLKQLQSDLGLTYLLITHNLALVRGVADTVGVMYLGRIMEIGRAKMLYERPIHPYTRCLLSALPTIETQRPATWDFNEIRVLPGDIPSPSNPPAGCVFHTRCPLRFGLCEQCEPDLLQIDSTCWVRCHLVRKQAGSESGFDRDTEVVDLSPPHKTTA